MAEKYVQVFCDYLEMFASLSDEQFGKLIRDAIRYKRDASEPEDLSPDMSVAWNVVKVQFDREHETYLQKVANARRSTEKRSKRWQKERWADITQSVNLTDEKPSKRLQTVHPADITQSVQIAQQISDAKLSTKKPSKRLQTVRSADITQSVEDNIILRKDIILSSATASAKKSAAAVALDISISPAAGDNERSDALDWSAIPRCPACNSLIYHRLGDGGTLECLECKHAWRAT